MCKLSQLALFCFDQRGCLNCENKVFKFLPLNIFMPYFVAFLMLPGVAFSNSSMTSFHSTTVLSDFRCPGKFSVLLLLNLS